MDQTLALVLTAKNQTEAALSQLDKGLKTTRQEIEKTDKAGKQLEDSFTKSSKKAGEFADGVGRVSTTLARSADAFGLPTQALRTLDDVMDVAELGFGNMSKSAAGFNVASAGVVGAGLAIGTALGSMANRFEVVRSTADKATAGLADFLAKVGLFETTRDQAAGATDHAAFAARMAKINEEAINRQIAGLKAQGKTVEEIAAIYSGKAQPAAKSYTQIVQEMVDKHKQATEAAKRAAEEGKRATEAQQQALERYHTYLKQQAEASAKFQMEWTKRGWDLEKEWLDDISKRGKEAADAQTRRFMAQIEAQEEAAEAARKAADEQKRQAEEEEKRQEAIRQAWIDKAGAIAGIVNELAGIFALLGVSAESNLGKAIAGMQDLASAGQSAAAAMASFSAGNILGGIGAGLSALGGVIKGVKGVFFGGQEEHKRTNDMRDQFVAAAGGLDALNRKAKDAGMTLDALLRARDRNALQGAIDQLNSAFGVTDQAIDKTKSAMQEFGISIGEMGPKFAQQQLDQQALSLFEKYQLLTQAGADHNRVIEAMGPKLLDYVNQARQAGVAIPEDMRKIVEELLAQGKILDENGQAFQTAEEAGITFGASLEQSMAKAAEQMERLVEAISRLYGLGDINIPVNVHPNVREPGAPGGGGLEPLAGGGVVTGWGVPAILHGTPGQPEFVLQSAQLKQLVAGAVQAAMASNGGSGRGGGSQVPPLTLTVDGAVLAKTTARRWEMGYGTMRRQTRTLNINTR